VEESKLHITQQPLKLEQKNKHKSLEFYKKNIDMYLTKLENNQTSLNKMSHLFLETTKLFSARNIPIRYLFFNLHNKTIVTRYRKLEISFCFQC